MSGTFMMFYRLESLILCLKQVSLSVPRIEMRSRVRRAQNVIGETLDKLPGSGLHPNSNRKIAQMFMFFFNFQPVPHACQVLS